jgi:hypothetical protein
MRYERAPEPSGLGPSGSGAGRPGGINWRTVAVQVVAFSMLAWLLAALLALFIVATSERGFAAALRISASIVAVAIIAFGLVALQRGPILFGAPQGGDVTRLIRPFGMISRSSDSFLRPIRTQSREVREDERNGLTALGVALVVAPQLFVVASVL